MVKSSTNVSLLEKHEVSNSIKAETEDKEEPKEGQGINEARWRRVKENIRKMKIKQ